MRSVAAAIGTGPASLYRYVATRDELVELMADQVFGELSYHEPGSGARSPTCSGSPIRAVACTTGTPWLLEVPATGSLPGPNAVAFIEHALAALTGRGPDRAGQAGDDRPSFPAPCGCSRRPRSSQRRAGQDTAQWQGSLAAYLQQMAAAASIPHLAAALAGPARR